ncbi:MAG: nuclear transport factor 2 family protein [Chloroflexi bacterium]|nr:MAG: nuclear transport factor 2 family protein [Chloroflexota bacterium]
MATQSDPQSVIDRLQAAQNQHDLEAFLACIASDYQSEQPVHPDRAFHGREQVRKNWSVMFSGVPDFRSEMLRSVVEGDTVWTEWHWSGTHTDGRPFAMRGVTIFGVRDERIVWGRLYMEPVQQTGAGIDAQIERWAQGTPTENK